MKLVFSIKYKYAWDTQKHLNKKISISSLDKVIADVVISEDK
jgi:hypothetical protein